MDKCVHDRSSTVSTILPSGFMSKAHAEQADHVVISQVYGGGGKRGRNIRMTSLSYITLQDQDVDT